MVDFGETLRKSRERAGLTQAEFGRLIGYSRTAVSRMESSADPRLTPRLLRRISEVLQTSTANLLSPDREDPVNRRQLLQGTAASAAMVATSRSASAAVGLEQVEEVSAAIDDLRRMDQLTGGDRLVYFAERLVASAERLLMGRPSTKLADQLQAVHGEAAVLAGWMAQDSGDLQKAAGHYSTALTASQLAGDVALSVQVCAAMAFLAILNERPTQAIQCIQAGQRAALSSHAGPRTRALLAAREAIARGQMGDGEGAGDAVQRVWRAHDSRHGTDEPWADFVSEAELTGMVGVAYGSVGEYRSAITAVRTAARMSSVERPRNAASWQAHLAITYARSGDPAQAAEVASAVLPSVRTLSSGRLRDRVRTIEKMVRPHGGIAEVRRFSERAVEAGLVA